jgi:hypothetical protein
MDMRPLRPRVDALEKQMSPGAGDQFPVEIGGQVLMLSAADLQEIIREAGGSSRGLPDPRERDMVAAMEAESGPS